MTTSERRRVTTLFADLVGYSTLAEHMDPEQLYGLIDRIFDDLQAAVIAGGGRVERFIGDAVLATFGARQAHEDDPRRAVEAALGMLEATRQRSESHPAGLQLRIGINSGLVVSGPVTDGKHTEIFGDAVNVAARLQQAANPGEILVGSSVWRRVRDHFSGEHIGRLEVKGRRQMVDAYRIIRSRVSMGRKQAPFVGRQDELALLELLWSNTLKANTHVVSVVGDAGVGKSRLLAEFERRQGARDVRVLCGGEVAYGPFVQVIHQILGAQPEHLEDLSLICESMPGVDEEIIRLLGAMLGLAGAPPLIGGADEHQKRHVFAAIWLFLMAAADERPLFLVLDDVHWCDRSSLDLIGFLLERLAGAPMMLVLAYRPGFDQVDRTTIRASHTGVRLQLLTPSESVAVACGFLGADELPSDLERLIAGRAEGNPFFIEELLQALIELGSLAVVDGRAVLAQVDVDIPDSVEGTIMARVDRLEPRARSVLQQAAVIGRAFSTELIESLTETKGVEEILDQLWRAQLIVAERRDQWTFKHALIQEVIYDTLLLRQRRKLHRRVAEALEAAEDAPLEVLAEHYARAEIGDKARQYAMAAGDAAAERMGFVEARDRYQTALRLWGDGGEEGRLSVLMKLAYADLLSADQAGATTALIEAEAGWRALGSSLKAGEALATLGRVFFWTGDSARADDALRRAIDVLGPEGSSPELAKALIWASALKIVTGEMREGAELASRGLAIDPAVLSDGARSSLMTTWGSCQVHMGKLEGLQMIRDALQLAGKWREPEALGRAYVNLVLCLSELNEDEALALAQEGQELMRRFGATTFEDTLAGREAIVLSDLGRYHEAEQLSREILETGRSAQVVPALLFAGLALTQVSIRTGHYEAARSSLDVLLPYARGMGGGMFLVPAFALEAELEKARNNPASAHLAATESLRVALDTSSLAHAFHALAMAAELLSRDAVLPLLERLKSTDPHPSFQARMIEAAAAMDGDGGGFHEAAEMFQSLHLPYHEARCRLGASEYGPDELARAREIIDAFQLGGGPLGARLRKLTHPHPAERQR